MLPDDVQDFVSYVNGYYKLQVTRAINDDDDDDDEGLAVRTADQRSSTSSSENGLTIVHYYGTFHSPHYALLSYVCLSVCPKYGLVTHKRKDV